MGNFCFSENTEEQPTTPNDVNIQLKDDSLLPLPTAKESLVFKGMYDFGGINKDDLSFKKEDRLEIDEASDNDWWTATNLATGLKGYIPSNFVCKDDDSPQAQDYWAELDKWESEKLLLLPGNRLGTFLVRPTREKSKFVLSVRDWDKSNNKPRVRYYRVRETDNGGFCITHRKIFTTMKNLIQHYKMNADGLCCELTDACPRFKPVVRSRKLEVSRDAVKMSQRLGDGVFGEVWRGKLRDVTDVAVKILKPGIISPENFLAKASCMHRLCHRKLVQLLAVCSQTEPVWIITEFMIHGTLSDYLRKDKGKTIRFPTITDMASQIAEGMAFLESEKFVHRDLRAANIFVREHNEVKVGLAGMMQETDSHGVAENIRIHIKWTAPEAALENQFSIKSDVWSFGVLLHELITFGRIPYAEMSGREVLQNVNEGYRMSKPVGPVDCTDSFYEIMLNCWMKNPEERPTFFHLHDLLECFLTEPDY